MGITGQVERHEVEAWLGPALEGLSREQVDELYRQFADVGPRG